MLMVKKLRFMLLSLLAMLTTATFAQKTVTIDFDNDYQTIFPTITGVSSSDSQAGDFTAVTVSSLIDGAVMVTVAPDDEASTPSRIWTASPRLRMYSGTFSVVSMSLPITKIEFNAHSKNFNLSAVEGTLDERVWTGSSQSPIFMVTKNTQISSIVVTLGEGGENPGGDDPGSKDDLLSKFKFKSGSFTDGDNQMTFDFTGIATYQAQDVDVTGNFVFDFNENKLCSKTTANLTFASDIIAQLVYMDAKSNSEDYESVTVNGATMTVVLKEGFNGYSKYVIKSMLKIVMDEEVGGYGVLSSPLTPNQANVLAGTLDKNNVDENGVSKEDVYIKGKIASIKYPFDAQHGTATFFISADAQNDFTFQCYSVYYLENKSWVEGNTQIKEGDEVIICGKVINYNGNTPETASKKAYIYSLNGVTKNEGGNVDPEPQVTQIGVAKALEIINALEDGKTTAEEYLVKGFVVGTPDFQRKADGTLYGNANFDIADEKGGATKLAIFRAKNFENAAFTEETISTLKEGDEVVIRGKLQKYVKNGNVTPELTSCYLVSINGSAGINAVIAEEGNGFIYNLAGQRVDANYKGVVIKNGQKMIQK